MKRIVVLFLALLLLCGFCGCDRKEASVSGEAGTEKAGAEVDVDLTSLSSTMVYSEVYQMMSSPEGYKGKTVKMRGSFSVYEDESTGKCYFACIIADATACCSQGLEFVLKKDAVYPEDYPTLGSEITVTGTFGTYYEGDYMYCQLSDAVME